MNVSETCRLCQSIAPCACKSALTSFFNLLQAASNRVTTQIPTSMNASQQQVSKARIDKLNGHFQAGITRQNLLQRLSSNQIAWRLTKLKDRRWYIAATLAENAFVHFRVQHDELGLVSDFISNPSDFSSWEHFVSSMMQILTREELESVQVRRVDLALDFKKTLSSILKSLDISSKRLRFSFTDRGSVRTGMRIGRSPETINIYDKAHESNLDSPLTRVEFQLSGKRVPSKHIYNLGDEILRQSPKIWSKLSGHEITLDKEASNLRATDSERLTELKTLLNRDGFLATRHALNTHRNFQRDYLRLLKVDSWPIQPCELFKSGIQEFFKQSTFNQTKSKETENGYH